MLEVFVGEGVGRAGGDREQPDDRVTTSQRDADQRADPVLARELEPESRVPAGRSLSWIPPLKLPTSGIRRPGHLLRNPLPTVRTRSSPSSRRMAAPSASVSSCVRSQITFIPRRMLRSAIRLPLRLDDPAQAVALLGERALGVARAVGFPGAHGCLASLRPHETGLSAGDASSPPPVSMRAPPDPVTSAIHSTACAAGMVRPDWSWTPVLNTVSARQTACRWAAYRDRTRPAAPAASRPGASSRRATAAMLRPPSRSEPRAAPSLRAR